MRTQSRRGANAVPGGAANLAKPDVNIADPLDAIISIEQHIDPRGIKERPG